MARRHRVNIDRIGPVGDIMYTIFENRESYLVFDPFAPWCLYCSIQQYKHTPTDRIPGDGWRTNRRGRNDRVQCNPIYFYITPNRRRSPVSDLHPSPVHTNTSSMRMLAVLSDFHQWIIVRLIQCIRNLNEKKINTDQWKDIVPLCYVWEDFIVFCFLMKIYNWYNNKR